VIIDEDGCLQEIKVQKGLNPFADQDVLRALSSYVFVPSFLKGSPVRVPYTMAISVVPSPP